jgi:hypothetical protein
MRGYASGGLASVPSMASGGYSGPTLATNSLGQGIMSGAKTASDSYSVYQKAQQDEENKNKNKTPDDTPGGTRPYSPNYPEETEPMRRGGKIKHTAGPRIGKDDGLIPAQRGEYVIRKSAVKKLGTKALGQVNRGKLPAAKRGR